MVRDHEVGGSNPLAPTNFIHDNVPGQRAPKGAFVVSGLGAPLYDKLDADSKGFVDRLLKTRETCVGQTKSSK